MVDRDFGQNPVTENEIINCYWYPVLDNTIGGWSVSNVDESVTGLNPYEAKFELGSFLTETQARHITDIHNKWYQDIIWATYADNVEFSWVNRVLEFWHTEAPLPNGVKPLTEDDWFDYDDGHEAS
jgi:hypothetical protein